MCEQNQKTMGLIKPNRWVQKANQRFKNWVREKTTGLGQKVASSVGGLYKTAVLDPQKEMNLELAQHQFDKNKEMWDLQNQYNTPLAQRQRMEEAGFNPNYMAGGGASSTGNASGGLPQYNVQAPTYDPMSFYSKIIGAAQGLLSLRAGVANIAKIRSQTGKLGIEEEFLRDTKSQRKMGIILGNEQRKTNTKLGDQLLQYRGGGLDQSLINPSGAFSKQRTAIDAQIDNTRARTIFQQHKNELMRKYGITTSDNFLFRMGIKALDTIGIDPTSWMKTSSQGLSDYMRSK